MSFASVFSLFRPVPLHRVPARAAGRLSSAFRVLLLGVTVALPGVLRAQAPGSLDSTFVSDRNDVTTFAVITQYSKGKETIIYGGDTEELYFTDSGNIPISGFDVPLFGDLGRIIYTLVPEALTITGTDKHNIYAGGRFGRNIFVRPTGPAQNITRLTPAGEVDVSFQPGKGSDDIVTAILPLPEGGLFVGGLFTKFNGQSFRRLALLNEDGSIDPTFQKVNITDGVFALAAQIDPATGVSNGQVLVGGDFSTVNNSTYTKLFRVAKDGTIDGSFKPVIDSRVLAIAVQPDGRIVIGGQFSTVNGQTVGHLARLNVDGSLDPTFNASVSVLPPQTSAPVAAYILRLLPDGRLYVGGQFNAVDGVTRQYLARINADGSLDPTFDPGRNITNSVQSIAVQEDNRIMVGETVSKKINNLPPPSLVRLYGDPVVALSSVSLAVTKPSAHEGTGATRKNGVFVFVRTGGDLSQPLTVYFAASGSAQAGTAFKPLAAASSGENAFRVTIPANQETLTLKVKPLNNVLPDAPETLTLSLLPSQDSSALYETGGAPVAGTVSIRNAR